MTILARRTLGNIFILEVDDTPYCSAPINSLALAPNGIFIKHGLNDYDWRPFLI
jgi:hypothetical protein